MFKETIDKKSYLFYKNIYDDSYGINLDFNTLFKLYSESEEELESLIRSKFPPAANNVLSKVYQIRNINNSRFNKLLNELRQQTKKQFNYEYITCDSFFSFKNTSGNVHQDYEHVCIIGCYGTTYYNFPDYQSQVKIQKGDMLFIPRGLKHNVLSPDPRIILSVGFYVNK